MYNINPNTIAGVAGIFGALTYILFFLLLLSANIALWKYIIVGGRKHHQWDEKGVDRRDIDRREDKRERK
jgi:hypothetical protein